MVVWEGEVSVHATDSVVHGTGEEREREMGGVRTPSILMMSSEFFSFSLQGGAGRCVDTWGVAAGAEG